MEPKGDLPEGRGVQVVQRTSFDQTRDGVAPVLLERCVWSRRVNVASTLRYGSPSRKAGKQESKSCWLWAEV